MSILGSIVSAIFNHGTPAAAGSPAATPSAPESAGTPAASASAAPASNAAPTASPTPSAPAAAPSAPVDVEAVLTALAAKHHERLDWKHSIVDLLKVLNLDSSLSARRELANELHYTGDEHDTATMNIWLHKQVIAELVKNGGKVPADLQH